MKKIIGTMSVIFLFMCPFFVGVAIGICKEVRAAEEEQVKTVLDIAQPIVIQEEELLRSGVREEQVITFRPMTEEEENELIARVVYSESNNQEMIGKVAVASVILNRAESRNMSVSAVIYEANQFADPWEGPLNTECTEAVRIARAERDLFPRNMIYFRAGDYHKKYGKPYMQIGGHYFSTEEGK